MTARAKKRGFAQRPADPDEGIKTGDMQPARGADAVVYFARPPINITPELRGWINVSAVSQHITVADMLRELFGREFPDHQGDSP